MARRKELQAKLKELKASAPVSVSSYEMNVFTGEKLRSLVQGTLQLDVRECFRSLETFLHGAVTPRICSIYGLRRTGKTTLLHQAIGKMSPADFAKAAYIKAKKNQTMSMLSRDIETLWNNGFRFVFIDEITFLDDFVDTASFLSDIYAAMGMKIVVSGTDSLGLWLASHEELYDRAYTIHTTWISYAEHARLLHISDVDEYIRYGGTLRAGETDFDDPELQSEEASFRDDESTRRYIDTAICQNIQHSLRCYENGTRFMHLQELYDAGELTGAINRVIEDMNHHFVLRVLTEDFQSGDLKLARKNLLRERDPALRTDVLDRIDIKAVTERLMNILAIRNQPKRTVEITQTHVNEIKEYLKALDLIERCPVRYADPGAEETENVLILQPGMRFCQAQALVHSLKKDAVFAELNAAEKDYVCGKILDEVRGRMLEEIVLIETQKRLGKKCEVFKYQFIGGEFDMVVYNPAENVCDVYEIKHSTEAVIDQCRHLLNEESCATLAARMAPIRDKYVIYRGTPLDSSWGVKYLNAGEFLTGLENGQH